MSGWRDECRGLQALVAGYGDDWDMPFPAAADALENLQAAVAQLERRFVLERMRS